MKARQAPTGAKSSGRQRQKNRTRRALVAAAAELVRGGLNPTVAEAAEAAEVSRATAYRYFPTQEMLLAEVALFAVGGPLAPDAMDLTLSPPEAAGRLARRVGAWSCENEQPLRTLLRLSLDPATGVRRPGHRISWIDQLLSPVADQLEQRTRQNLTASLALLFGIDPIVVMRDIASVSQRQALDALEWAARTLVAGALGESSRPSATARQGRSPRKT